MGREISTTDLMSMLQNEDNHHDMLLGGDMFTALSFSDHLKQRMTACGVSVAQLIAAADISKTYIYQILREERRVGRDTALRIALALRLTVEQTQRLLTLSGNSVLYPRVRRDAALIFALERRMTLADTEELLATLPEKPIFGRKA